MKTKAQISVTVTVKLISAFCFQLHDILIRAYVGHTRYLLHKVPTSIYCDKMKENCDYCFNLLFLFFMICMMIKFEINKLICILFLHLSSIILENFNDLILIIPEMFEFLELHTYKFGLV